MFENSVVGKLRRLVDRASQLGLGAQDCNNALAFLEVNEWGECFDTVAAQLNEYNIGIDYEFLKLAREIQDEMQIDKREYLFLDELLKKGSYLTD
jgi:hypothetical protein